MADAKSDKKPNILVIWGDDIGISNLSCYTHGLMGYQTPNIDRIAKEGMMFTDSYGEQSCTAGRSSFITGQSVYRTGLSKVGIPGAPVGMTEKIVTIAAALKNQGYATGQFGKNHLGDLNHMLPTNHGFDEFFGNLYHLNAEEEPEMDDYSAEKDFPNFSRRTFGPRGVIHSWATDKDDPTVEPRWGRVGKQKIEDTGPLTTKRMETCDDEFVAAAKDFIKRQNKAGKPFFVWLNTTHMHLYTHTKKESLGQAGRWQSPYHDTMIDHDKNVGQMLDYLDELGIADEHVRHVLDRQRPAPQLLAGRRHDAVPQREEHQLGRRVPHSAARRAGRARSRRAKSRTGSCSITTGSRRSSRWPATPTSWRSSRRATGDRPDLQEPHRRLQPGALPHRQGEGKPAQALLLHQRRRRHARHALRQLEGRLHGAALPGHDAGLGGAVHPLAPAEDLQPAHRPVRVRRRHVEHVLRVVPVSRLHPLRRQAVADKFAATFKDFPPIQKPNTFTIDDALAKMSDSEPAAASASAGGSGPGGAAGPRSATLVGTSRRRDRKALYVTIPIQTRTGLLAGSDRGFVRMR